MPVILKTSCDCLIPTRLQAIALINNNLVTLFLAMATDFVGHTVSLVGDGGCGCTEAQILVAINQNIVEFGLTFSGGGGSGGPDTIGSTANNSGNSTITPDSAHHVEIVTVGGLARTSVFILDTAGRSEGDRLYLRFVPPAVANIVQEVRNATAGGTLLYSYETDGSGTDIAYFDLYFDGAAWQKVNNAVPVV